MEKYFNGISNFFGIVGGVILYLLGGWDTLITVLFFLSILDFITGILKGLYTKKLSSDAGRKGILKKISIYFIVSVAVLCEKIGIPALREMTIMFFVVNESISILENVSAMDVPIPEKIKSTLLQLREQKEEK